MRSVINIQFLEFLRHDLAISEAAIAVVLRHRNPSLTQLPVLLWQNGLVTLHQLDQIYDWLENQSLIRDPLSVNPAVIDHPIDHPIAS
ncbi:DUF2949 domain-containing protein [Synechococcales cyanobacterium C]|uniref:DUF2949 domain-containing protein n=1 Tax=Petrachloros mirabilis ULC683 TaxID=2781853 RepID=A0A8K2A809_9CYAN|nr:DUF2949 domain-containing protein [Petrachloros mirabilis]NCJ07476.1 DUF2949 domain-containing protein [Petrachloros mirabilis ULC683]